MADLIAQGEKAQQRWRRHLPEDQSVVLGRGGTAFSADWDDRISRQHAALRWQQGRLQVTRLPEARNAIFTDGVEKDRFHVRPGEPFVIGGTKFIVAVDHVNVSLALPQPVHEQSFSADYLQQLQFRNARARIDVLARLPEVISGAASDDELFVRLVNLLLSGVARADAAALVSVSPGDDGSPVDVLHWDRHATSEGDFQPSERLIRTAVARGQSVLHVWSGDGTSTFTVGEGVDWAFCTPVVGEACPGWAMYLAGRFDTNHHSNTPTTDSGDLHDDLKFAEVVAQTLHALRHVGQLQQRQAGLRQFFSPIVLDALADRDPEEVLAPREADVCVMFCDLRGFALESERSADDLLGLLDRVSRALGVTTRHIRQQRGVVGDFQGDAVMGFWGWPLDDDTNPIERACRAALAIQSELDRAANTDDDPLAGFRLGIGIASGRAVAGKIGTVDQVKVTVFGPVVNLASRLEGMTKLLHASILLDEPTAEFVAQHLSPEVARRRRLARVRPLGIDMPLLVSELLPAVAIESPAESPQPPLATGSTATRFVPDDRAVEQYEAALDAFHAGRWDEAFGHLHQVPAQDRAKDFLTGFIARHNRTPPAGWDGIIVLSEK